tara:strand:- start:357 stop:659 length:303 start_codon:yes stop_codon:yes gene_type:complete
MLTTSTRIRIQEILSRISKGKEVSLAERIYINKYASSNQNVSAWLRKASYLQRNKHDSSPIDKLLNGLDLCSSDPYSTFNPEQDDLGEWFSGAPSWIKRS